MRHVSCTRSLTSNALLATALLLTICMTPTLQQNNTLQSTAQYLTSKPSLVKDGGNTAAATLECSKDTLFYTELDSLALPSTGNVTIFVGMTANGTASLSQADDVLFSLGGMTAALNRLQGGMMKAEQLQLWLKAVQAMTTICWPAGTLTISMSRGYAIKYTVTNSSSTTVYSVAVADKQKIRVCLNFSCPSPSSVSDNKGRARVPKGVCCNYCTKLCRNPARQVLLKGRKLMSATHKHTCAYVTSYSFGYDS